MEVKEPNPKYLQVTPLRLTEIGPLPHNWSAERLGNVSSCLIGLTYSPLDVAEHGTLVLRSSNIQDGRLAFSDCVHVRMVLPERVITREGDLLVCVRNGSRNLIGKAALIDSKTAGSAFGAFMSVLRSNDGPYLRQVFETASLKRQIEQGMGATINQITNRDMDALLVPWPNDSRERYEIGSTLTDVDTLVDSLEQLLTKKRLIKQGAMQELLTGKRRLPGFRGDWMPTFLGQIAKVKTGSKNNQDKVEEGEYPFFVRSQSVERIGTYTHDCEAILVPGEGGIGSIYHYIRGRFALHQRVYGITDFSDEVLGRFLFFYMRVFFGAHALENSVKATVDSLRLPTFLNFELRLPPTKNEQAAIVGVLSDLESETEALESRLIKTRSLKQAMSEALLTGRIRLVKPTE